MNPLDVHQLWWHFVRNIHEQKLQSVKPHKTACNEIGEAPAMLSSFNFRFMSNRDLPPGQPRFISFFLSPRIYFFFPSSPFISFFLSPRIYFLLFCLSPRVYFFLSPHLIPFPRIYFLLPFFPSYFLFPDLFPNKHQQQPSPYPALRHPLTSIWLPARENFFLKISQLEFGCQKKREKSGHRDQNSSLKIFSTPCVAAFKAEFWIQRWICSRMPIA